jgi:hypothetical protein
MAGAIALTLLGTFIASCVSQFFCLLFQEAVECFLDALTYEFLQFVLYGPFV